MAGNAAIVVAWVAYVEHFVNKGQGKLGSIIIKFIPLLFMSTIGLFFVRSHNFGAFNASGVRNPRRNVPRAERTARP